MDPSIVKQLLEDDEDETMHSGADLEVFQAALNRDIEGDVSASQPSDPDPVVLSQGSNNSRSLPQLSTATQDENTAGQIQEDQKIVQHRDLHSYEMELKQQGSVAENMKQKNDASLELNRFPLPQKQPHGDLQQEQAEQKLLHIPETTGMPISGIKPSSTQEPGITPNLKSESQYLKLQKMSSQQPMITEQNPLNRSIVPFVRLSPFLLPKLDKERGMELNNLYGRLKSSPKHQLLPQASVQQQAPRMLSNSAGATQLNDPRSFALHLTGANSPTDPSHIPPSTVQVQTDSRHSVIENSARNLLEAECHSDSHGMQISLISSSSAGATQLNDPRSFPLHLTGANSPTNPSHIPPLRVQVQTDSRHPVIENSARTLPEAECHSDSHGMQMSLISSSSAVASNQERECSSVPILNKPQQQQLYYRQSSSTMHGNNGGTCHQYSGTNFSTCTLPVKPQPPDAQLRQIPQHPSVGSVQSGGGHGTNIMSVSKMEIRYSLNDPSRLQGGSISHFTNNATLQPNPVPWQSSNKEQNSSRFSSMAYVKQELIDQTAEQQHKPPLPNSQGLPSVSSALLEQGNASSCVSMDESLEKQSSRMGVSTLPSSSTSTVPANSVSPSITMQVNPSVSLGPRITSGISPSGIYNKTPPKKHSIGQKKPLEALGSSPLQSSKKQKVSGEFSDIEQLNDVTAISGVNLREEEEQLFSGPKEDSRASEAFRKFVQEEEKRLILQKGPLLRKLAEIMVKCGLKSVTPDVEQCLSLCVEERIRGLINNLIRVSKQRVDAEKSRHHTITTCDVRQQIMDLNRKAREEMHAEAEKVRRLNETNKEEDDKMKTKAANVAARAAVGGDDMFLKWQFMAQARQKREGEIGPASGSQPGKDVNCKRTSTAGRIMDSQEAEKRGGAAPVATAAGTAGKSGRNQVIIPQTRMARSISVKDMIAILEREPQMSKSTLIYRLHERIKSGTAVE